MQLSRLNTATTDMPNISLYTRTHSHTHNQTHTRTYVLNVSEVKWIEVAEGEEEWGAYRLGKCVQ